jgi:hypothetical protein
MAPNLKQAFIARREFRLNGWNYAAGDVFDWQRIGVSIRKVYQLLSASYIVGEDDRMKTKGSPVMLEAVAKVKAEKAEKEVKPTPKKGGK